MKTTRRLFAFLMVVCLLAGYAIVPVYAAELAATMTFEVENRTAFSEEEQVWVSNGVTLTNTRNGAYSPIADYSDPVRLYKGTTVKIEYPGMTKLVFTCSGGKVVTEESIGSLGTVTTEDSVVTLALAEAKDSIEFTAAAQIRFSKIEVYTGTTSEGGSEEPTEPEVTEPEATVETVADGTYVISTGAYTFAALGEDQSYGYAPANDASAPTEADVMTITNVDGGFTMQDCYGRYVYMSGSYNSFNVSETAPSEGHVWQLMNDGTNLYIVNVLKEKTLAYSTEYTSWGAYPDSSLTDAHLTALTLTPYEASEGPVAGETVDVFNYQWTWNEEGTEATITVNVPANTYNTYNLYNVNGMLLSINGGEASKLTAPGFMMPCEVVITNETDADADYVLKIAYPVGAAENPEVLTDSDTAVLDVGSQGYFYTYTAPGRGAVKVTVSGEGWVYCVNNLTTYKYGDNHWSDEDPVVAEMVPVAEGDKLQIMVNTYDPANPYGDAPAGEVSVAVEFIAPVEPVEGETITIEPTEWQWNEDNTEGTLTVTVPAGTSNTYIARNLGGMQLSINGGDPTALAGDFWNPPSFVIANDMPFDQEYTLVVNYPLGHVQNPDEIWWLGEQLVSLEAGDMDGYYYTYTVESDCTLDLTINGINSDAEGVVADICVMMDNSYAMPTLLADGVDGVLSLDVTAGTVLTIQVVVLPDANYEWPAASVNWEINYPAGTEMNPLYPEYEWNDDETVGTATITVEPGETFYLALIHEGAELSINGGEPETITGNRYMPQILPIENSSDQAVELVLTVSYPVGTLNNPADLAEGENKVSLAAGSQGYHYDYVAPAAGTVTITVSGEGWQYYVNNVTQGVYGDIHWSDDDPVVSTVELQVKAGDEILVFVNTYGPTGAPAGDVTVTFSFEEGLLGDVNDDGEVTVLDLMRLANYFANGVEINAANADVNADGAVTVLDLMRLANYFAGNATLG